MNIKTWIGGVEFEESARKQVENTASMPFVWPHVAVMPDVHAGIGSTVGTVVPTVGAIIPACVGVDIGCGMMAVRLDIAASQLPDNLHAWRSAIEAAVPVGNAMHADESRWKYLPPDDGSFTRVVNLMGTAVDWKKVGRQVGTLGGGNHFIEICTDESDDVWVMLHSGSRGIGNQIGTKYIDIAKRDMERWYIHLPDSNLAYIPTGSEHYADYIQCVWWAQQYAAENRAVMLRSVLEALKVTSNGGAAVECHHNYVSTERHFGRNMHITRKGAVSAREGELGIIPGSMGAKSYIVRGKGNRDSFHSCSHGAGRRMSRTEARESITEAEFAEQVAGVECRRDADVIDEAPAAYKDIDAVMEAQKDLVEVVHTLKQVLCVKG